MTASVFADAGFWVSPPLFDGERLARLSAQTDALGIADAGERDLLALPFCQNLAAELRAHPDIGALLPAASVAVQCTYFEKSAGRNWLVPLHQDLSIPVSARSPDPQLRGWSDKADGLYVQAPDAVLQQLCAVRIHLDDCGLHDGPLRVVPGSHRHGRLDAAQALALRDAAEEITCLAPAGAALVLRPLLLHASSKSTGSSRRRVLHLLFGPPEPGHGLAWRRAV